MQMPTGACQSKPKIFQLTMALSYAVRGQNLSFDHAECNGVQRSIWRDSSLRYCSVLQ
ncbi:hypothetical protein MC7420_3598 [Coleofasciculus chthonoplastes PCC 7420]|uniref:Uncharacterized protein n=1 Tax=Coleofasciculus chthonoplastes PCC 7420 TaxID=118168 RepID=B4W063_9CYAN|nr:hypothetical protein MC7420_3598 [Coleofasciculus chthonoplastes PCC 7420]